MKKIVLMVVGVVTLNGCAAVLVGGMFYKGSKTKGQRQEFTTQLQKTNLEREKAGLKSLDWCSEAYKFEPKFAKQNKNCAVKIAAYESGDTHALDLATADVPQKNN